MAHLLRCDLIPVDVTLYAVASSSDEGVGIVVLAAVAVATAFAVSLTLAELPRFEGELVRLAGVRDSPRGGLEVARTVSIMSAAKRTVGAAIDG